MDKALIIEILTCRKENLQSQIEELEKIDEPQLRVVLSRMLEEINSIESLISEMNDKDFVAG